MSSNSRTAINKLYLDFKQIAILEKFGPDIISIILNNNINELNGEFKRRKSACFETKKVIEYDCQFETPEAIFILEWSNYIFIEKRQIYYMSSAYYNHLECGDDYEKLKPVFLININTSVEKEDCLIHGSDSYDQKSEETFQKAINLNVKYYLDNKDIVTKQLRKSNLRLLYFLKIITQPLDVIVPLELQKLCFLQQFLLKIMGVKRKIKDIYDEEKISVPVLKTLKNFLDIGVPLETVAKTTKMDKDTLLNLLSELDSAEVKIYIYIYYF